MTQTAAIIGGGVIGGGWAARFLLMGWDVRVYDPGAEAERKLGEVLDNARRSLPGLYEVALPDEGRLSFHDRLEDAVKGAAWIQESVPERVDIKHQTYAALQAACDPTAIIASSTSGYTPSQLQEGAARPDQILVAHPFNPVYLLPLIELVGSPKTPMKVIEQASEILTGIGMFPLHVRNEIEAHIADRFLEAVWREALWLIKDGVATTREIDDAIRYGFGLRWGQMGLFETYRVAGGEAGMKHFISQFGPALQWNWTKLMDVPELTEELIEMIAAQSDEQSGHMTIRELERKRDNNLVAKMRALKAQDWGAGAHLNLHDVAMKQGEVDTAQAIITVDRAVPLDWTDYNGHMTESRYLHAFADATDRFMEIIGCDTDYIETGGSYFTAETHIRHLDETHAGARIRVETICLLGQGKKMHLFHQMYEGTRLLASGEHLLLHVDLETRKSCPPAPHVEERLVEIARAHEDLARPEGIGRAIRVAT